VLPAVPLVVPDVPLVAPEVLPLAELPVLAFLRTNLSLALLVDPVALVPPVVEPVPEVPVEPPDMESAFCRHPVTVMLLLL
jgi:hypothetical protein